MALKTGWRYKMSPWLMITSSNGNISALLAICAGNSPGTDEFPAYRPVTRSFDVFFDLRLNKRLSKHSWGWLFETLPCPLWRHIMVGVALLSRYTAGLIILLIILKICNDGSEHVLVISMTKVFYFLCSICLHHREPIGTSHSGHHGPGTAILKYWCREALPYI